MQLHLLLGDESAAARVASERPFEGVVPSLVQHAILVPRKAISTERASKRLVASVAAANVLLQVACLREHSSACVACVRLFAGVQSLVDFE